MQPETYRATRESLHAVAEHVLAAALHQATGRIGLRATPGGFGTPWFTTDDGSERQLRVEGIDLVLDVRVDLRRRPLTTLREAAAFAEVTPGAPADVYTPATPLDLDAPLALDPTAARRIGDWYTQADAALTAFRDMHLHQEPSIAQLWPEHFDLAITMADVNYGASPGDAGSVMPYAYVGPWRTDDLADDFWNAPFGASRSSDELPSVGTLLAFFTRGHDLAT
jgi:hypothetical protein